MCKDGYGLIVSCITEYVTGKSRTAGGVCFGVIVEFQEGRSLAWTVVDFWSP